MYIDHTNTEMDAGVDVGRRTFMQLAGVSATILGVAGVAGSPAFAQDNGAWDKVFPKSDQVDHRKVTFTNRLGITLVADLYAPKSAGEERLPALAVGHPFGGVKEQTAGLYAQTMAERGFVTLAFDASYQGESGGTPHYVASPEAYVEDFSAAVDFLGTHPQVDRNRIGVIGICGSGGWALKAAQIDPRMRAIATVSMYDIGQAQRQGLSPTANPEAEKQALQPAAEQRWSDVDNGKPATLRGVVNALAPDTDPVSREFYEYYRTERGQHPRGTTEITITSRGALYQFDALTNIEAISPRPILLVIGETAHSRIFSEQAYARAADPKELYIVPGAGHVDLYDKVDQIPWDKLGSFFDQHLTA